MRRAWPLAILLGALASGVQGQSVESSPRIQSYEVTDPEALGLQSLRVLTVPIAARVPLTDWATASLRTAYASTTVTLPNGATGDMEGWVDATVLIEARRGPITATMTAVLPTGQVVQDLEEATIVGILASDLFPVSVRQWGSGGGVGFDVAYSARWGPRRLGLSAGVVRLGRSEPFGSEAWSYQPGVQMRARAALETAVGDAGLLTVLVGLQRFGTDVIDGESVYRAGMQLEGTVSYVHAFGSRAGALFSLGIGSSDEGTVDGLPTGSGSAAAPILFGGAEPLARQVVTGSAEVRAVRSPRLALTPRVGLQLVRSPQGLSQGWLTSVGARLEYRALGVSQGRRLLVTPSFALRTGRILADDASQSGLRGWEIGFGLRWVGR